MTAALLFVVGLVALVAGGELLVRGSSRLALALGLSPLVVGLTVVAFGTSAPELAVSVRSAASGEGAVALGNVVGSNIFNILAILGLSALIAPLVVSYQLIRQEVPIMCIVAALAILLSLDERVSRIDGAILASGVVVYTVFLVWQSRRANRGLVAEYAEELQPVRGRRPGRLPRQVGLMLLGLAMLVVGANWLVDGAVQAAGHLGLSETVIGLTIVAAGTSLPEVATSVLAALRGERDIAVGNAVGSCIFNILCVLGFAALVAPDSLVVDPGLLRFDMIVMLVVSLACLPIFFTGNVIARWEGLVFVAYYCAYTGYLVLDAQGHDSLDTYSVVMLTFVLPLTILTFIIAGGRELRGRRRVAPATGSGRNA